MNTMGTVHGRGRNERVIVNDVDVTPRYAPKKIICKMVLVPVEQYVAHPHGVKPAGCPLAQPDENHCILEFKTSLGSRWHTFEKAWINSQLRMIVEGFNARDEVLRSWKVCKTV